MMKTLIPTLTILSILTIQPSPGHQPNLQASGDAHSGLTVDQVVKMAQAGLSEDLIITRVRRDGKGFDLSLDDILLLKKSGITDRIIKVMMDPKADVAPTQPTTAGAGIAVGPQGIMIPVAGSGVASGATTASGMMAGDPDDPLAPHDSGIYVLMESRDGKPKMTVLERAAYQGSKTGGLFTSAMTYGIKKAKVKAIIPGPQASIRVGNSSPTFYFYFDDKSAGLGKSYFGVGNLSNPNQFALVKLEAKKANRETIIGQVGAFGASTGTHEKSMVPFKSERIRAGLYKVIPTAPMEDGEYCFLASGPMMGASMAGASAPMDLFDFAISTR